jgi:hypothetical protein
MGAPVVIRQRAADISSGVNSRDDCRNATSPVGTAGGNIVGSIVGIRLRLDLEFGVFGACLCR